MINPIYLGVGTVLSIIVCFAIAWWATVGRPAKRRQRAEMLRSMKTAYIDQAISDKLGYAVEVCIADVKRVADLGLPADKSSHAITGSKIIYACWVSPVWLSRNEHDACAVNLHSDSSVEWRPERPMLVMFEPTDETAGKWLAAGFGDGIKLAFLYGPMTANEAPFTYLDVFPAGPLAP